MQANRVLAVARPTLPRAGHFIAAVVILAWAGLAPPPARAAEPAVPPGAKPAATDASYKKALTDYDNLFGDEERQVVATRNLRDDAKFANDLVDKAKKLSDEAGLLRIMYEKAYEYGVKEPGGYAAAATAARWLLASSDKHSDWQAKLMDIYRLQLRRSAGEERATAGEALIAALRDEAARYTALRKYAEAVKDDREAASIASTVASPAGPMIAEDMRVAQSLQQAQEKVDRLRAKLEADPTNAVIRAMIVETCLLDLNDPDQALEARPDDTTRSMLTIAKGPPTALSEKDQLDLAAWYGKLAERASGAARAAALGRAQLCYAGFLETHEKQDSERLMGTLGMTDIMKRLAQAGNTLQGSPFGDRIVVWNSHHGQALNAGSLLLRVTILYKGQALWLQEAPIEFAPDRDTSLRLRAPIVAFDGVRVDILRWHGVAASLSEVEVFRNGKNVALHAPVKASGSYDGNFDASKITDGIETSSKQMVGYWIAPAKQQAAWVEVELGSAVK